MKTPPKNYTRPVDFRNSKKERRKAKRAESALRRNKRKYLADAHLGIFSPEESPAEMSLFGGYKVTNDFAVGLLVNYGVYEIRFDEPEFVGVMPAIRYQLSTEEKGTRFYAEMAAGIAVPSNNEQFGEDFIRDRSIGLSLRPSIGLRFVTERTTMFSFALAVRYLSHSAFISDSDFGNPGQVITQQYSKKYILPTLTFGFGF